MVEGNARIPALLVAGDAERAEGYELKLEIDGYAVTTVGSVTAARQRAASVRPEVVFVVEPGLAQELVRMAHLEPLLTGVPVIALTQDTGRAILLKAS